VATGAYASSNGHNGIDYACNSSTKLIASADGFVETVELTTTYGYGRHVRIRVQGGVLIYGHMLEVYVKLGDKIKEGQVIGLSDGAVGMPYAGNSTGNHLHFEYRLDRPTIPEKQGNRKYWAINTLPITLPCK
jgi:murein DD-endopeptidase MepM/ murein hydrolase activator NlpD